MMNDAKPLWETRQNSEVDGEIDPLGFCDDPECDECRVQREVNDE